MLGQLLCIPPRLPIPASTFYVFLFFFFWVLPGTSCSSTQVSWHLCRTSCSLGWTTLELSHLDPWILTSFLGPHFCPSPYPTGLYQASLKRPKPALLKSQLCGRAFCPSSSSQSLNSNILWSLHPWLPLTFASLMSPSFPVTVSAHSRHPLQCYQYQSAFQSLFVSSQLVYDPSPGRAPWAPVAFSHKGKFPLLIFLA